MSGAYEGRQIVGMDLHRRRSVLVRMTDAGEVLETTRISKRSGVSGPGDGPRRGASGGRVGSNVWLVLGCGHPRRVGCVDALGAPPGGEGLRVPAS